MDTKIIRSELEKQEEEEEEEYIIKLSSDEFDISKLGVEIKLITTIPEEGVKIYLTKISRIKLNEILTQKGVIAIEKSPRFDVAC